MATRRAANKTTGRTRRPANAPKGCVGKPEEADRTDGAALTDGVDRDTVRNRLRAAGLRITKARVAVLKSLLDAEVPLTHGEVCDRLADHGHDRATLYRNLVDLTQAGLLTRTDLGDHLWRFGTSEGHTAFDHPHFVCDACGDVTCLPQDVLVVRRRRGIPKSLTERNVEIQIRGLCNACA